MASILFCSEMGAGFGHLMPHRDVLAALNQRGHSIHIAVRDLTRATKAFEGLPFQYWQAPIPQSRPEFVFNPPINFSHVLHNSGMGDPISIAARMAAWRSIFSATRPRLAILDHSPAALLALRGTKVQTVLTGSGFEIPANASPIPAFGVTVSLATPGKLAADDNRLLIAFNAALAKHGCPALTSVAQLFHEVTTTIFRTLPEFDHVPNRGPAQFLGLPADPPRKAMEWPPGEGSRIFAYLKPSEILDTLLTELNDLKLPTIIASDGISKAQRDKYSTATVRFVPPTVDIAQMGRESHFAITNASLTTSVRLLLQGCPLITIPLQLEQAVTADNIRRLGAGLIVRANVKEDIARSLSEMLNHARCRNAAQAFAAKYAGQPDNYVERAVAILDGLLGTSAAVLQENLPAAAVPAAPAPVRQIPTVPVVAVSTTAPPSATRPHRKLAVITCHFNPCGYEAPRQNFLRFVAALELQGVPWYAIELAFDDQPFALPERPEILRKRTTHVLWHKERLLNLLIQHVPPQYDRIAWVDADIFFTNPRWVDQAERLLDTVPIVQLFEFVMLLDRSGDPVEFKAGVALRAQQGNPQAKSEGFAATGFAWAAQRQLLERHGLPDRLISGAGDTVLVHGMYGWFDNLPLMRLVRNREIDMTWVEQFHTEVKGQVGVVPGTVQHLWHGDRANRKYVQRHQMFIQHGYDSERDFRIGPDGVWEWTGANPALEAAVREHFLGRREDG